MEKFGGNVRENQAIGCGKSVFGTHGVSKWSPLVERGCG